MSLIRIADLTLTYGDLLSDTLAPEPTLREVSLSIEEGELVLVIGPTGSGKSTLLGLIGGQVPHFTGGHLQGQVTIDGRDLREHRPRDLADVIGVVGQNPLAGFVTDTVEEELAYAMEQIGLPPPLMRKRVEETLDLLGIADLRQAHLKDLSGGQQQRVAIGSVLTAHPRILVLDEPTSALDPTGAEDVLATLSRLVHDLGVTVVVAEHRIERVIHLVDSIIEVGADGRVRHGDPAQIMADAAVAPPIVELARVLDWSPVPLSIRDARRRARRSEITGNTESAEVPPAITSQLRSYGGAGAGAGGSRGSGPAITGEGIVVRYGEVAAVADVSVSFDAGSISVLMGRNGAGKSSLLWALQGTGARTSGTVEVEGGHDPAELSAPKRRQAVTLVPQSASDLLYLETVAQECAQSDAESGAAPGTCAELLERLVPGIDPRAHPRDLSEGQRLALVLAVQLTGRPPVVMLDEPTRGLDYAAKAALISALREMARPTRADGGRAGQCIIVSTHDVEFAAQVADRVLVMAEGEIVADGPPREILVSSPAFAPQVSKILAPAPLLTVADVRTALAARGES
ncbi:MAG: ATP-binding cassette domain-containing protein [Actinomycetia bacterium]|nr:ATP-binding cassette domain-containing protein [Actinomycetes bacterium]